MRSCSNPGIQGPVGGKACAPLCGSPLPKEGNADPHSTHDHRQRQGAWAWDTARRRSSLIEHDSRVRPRRRDHKQRPGSREDTQHFGDRAGGIQRGTKSQSTNGTNNVRHWPDRSRRPRGRCDRKPHPGIESARPSHGPSSSIDLHAARQPVAAGCCTPPLFLFLHDGRYAKRNAAQRDERPHRPTTIPAGSCLLFQRAGQAQSGRSRVRRCETRPCAIDPIMAVESAGESVSRF